MRDAQPTDKTIKQLSMSRNIDAKDPPLAVLNARLAATAATFRNTQQYATAARTHKPHTNTTRSLQLRKQDHQQQK